MTDVRTLLDRASGPPAGELELEGLFARARRERRLRRAGALATVAGVIVTALAVVPGLGSSRESKVRTDAPADRGGTPDAGRTSGDPDRRDPNPRPGASASSAKVDPRTTDRGSSATSLLPGVPVPTSAMPPRPAGPAAVAAGERIAYDGVSLVDADGSNPVRIASGRAPAWSPDGRRLAFVVLLDPHDDCTAPTWGPGEGCKERGHLAVMDADGANAHVIRGVGWGSGVATGYAVDSPAWSPDGTRIAFVQRYCGQGDPMEWRGADGCRPPTNPGMPAPGRSSPLSWSEIRTVGADGSGESLVVTSGSNAYNESPSWSADGRHLAFATALNPQGSHWDIVVARPDGAGQANLTKSPDADEYDPAWSPDSRRIAFTEGTYGDHGDCSRAPSHVSVVDADGSSRGALTGGSGVCGSQPAWSSDGAHLVFVRTTGSTRSAELWLMRSTGAGQKRIGAGNSPAFRPRR